MGWKEKFTFLSPTFVEHEVQGTKLHFYPISVKFIFELKTLGKPIAQALATLFSDKENDTGTTIKNVEDSKKGLKENETVIVPVSVEIAVLRDQQKQGAFEALFEALSEQDNAMLLGRMLMDSLREDFNDTEREDRNLALDFIKDMDFAVLRDMITGLVKSNAKVLGPLEDIVAQFSKAFLSGLPKKDDETPVVTLVPKEKAEPETTGPTLQTPSPNLSSKESPGK